MSLQGSLDTFALPDVLVLLASTSKSGELYVAGNRTSPAPRQPQVQGRLWLDAGRLVGADVPKATDAPEAVFELLRLVDGTFSFGPGSAPDPWDPAEVEPVLGEAQARLAEWREIERVVPSMTAWLELNAEPPTAHVSMRADQWRLVVCVAGGCTVEGAIDRLGLAELPGCRAVKEVIEGGLLTLRADGVPADDPTATASAIAEAIGAIADATQSAVDHAPARESRRARAERAKPAPEPEPEPEPVVSFWSTPVRDEEDAEAPLTFAEPPRAEPVDPEPVVEAVAASDAPAEMAVPDWRADLGDAPDLDAIANLPKRSRRAAALAEEPASDDTEPAVAGTDEMGEGDEPLNRGLLLKFLSSVRN